MIRLLILLAMALVAGCSNRSIVLRANWASGQSVASVEVETTIN